MVITIKVRDDKEPLMLVCKDCYQKFNMKGDEAISNSRWQNIVKKSKYSTANKRKFAYYVCKVEAKRHKVLAAAAALTAKGGHLSDDSAAEDDDAKAVVITEEMIKDKIDQLTSIQQNMIAAAADWNPDLSLGAYQMYACKLCKKAPIQQNGWYMILSPSDKRSFACAFCGHKWTWGESGKDRVFALMGTDRRGDVHLWRFGNISPATDSMIGAVRAMVLAAKLNEVTRETILERIQNLNNQAVLQFARHGFEKSAKSVNLDSKWQSYDIIQVDRRLSLPANPGTMVKYVDCIDLPDLDENMLLILLSVIVGTMSEGDAFDDARKALGKPNSAQNGAINALQRSFMLMDLNSKL
jgi:hypothetical protein